MSDTGSAAPPAARRGRGARLALVLTVAALVVAFFVFDLGHYLSLDALKQNREALQHWRTAHPVAALATYMVAYVAMAALSLPGAAVLTLAGGAIFGVATGTDRGLVREHDRRDARVPAARFVLRDARAGRASAPGCGPIEEGIARDGAFYLFTLRLVPLVPVLPGQPADGR